MGVIEVVDKTLECMLMGRLAHPFSHALEDVLDVAGLVAAFSTSPGLGRRPGGSGGGTK